MQTHHPEETPDIPLADSCFCRTVCCRWHRFAAAYVHEPNTRFANKSPAQHRRKLFLFPAGSTADSARKTGCCTATPHDSSAFLPERFVCQPQSAFAHRIKAGRRKQRTRDSPNMHAMKHVSFFFAPLSIDGVVFSFKSPYLDPSYIRSIIGINEVYVKIYARETHFYIKKSGLSPPAQPLKHAKRSCSAHAVNSRAVLCVKKLPLCLDNHSSLSRNCNYCAFVFSR